MTKQIARTQKIRNVKFKNRKNDRSGLLVLKIAFAFIFCYFYGRRLLEGHPLQVIHKQNLGRGFYPFTTPGCCTARIRAGSDGIEPACCFVLSPKTVRSRAP